MTRLELGGSRQVVPETSDDALDTIGRLEEICHASSPLAAVGPQLVEAVFGIAKQYVVGRRGLHLHILWRTQEFDFGYAKQLCAVLHADIPGRVLTLRAPYPTESGGYCFGDTDEGQKRSVLVEIVQSPDNKGVYVGGPAVLKVGRSGVASSYRIPSLVWLQSLDACPMPFEHPLQQQTLLAPVIFGVRDDGPSGVSVGTLPPFGQLEREVVEDRSQVVDNISRHQADASRPFDILPSADDIVAGLLFEFSHETVGVGIRDGADVRLQRLQVLAGAFDLPLRAVEGVRHA
jgi:hypothetical protein